MNSVRRGLARVAIAAFALIAVIPGAPALAATGNSPQSWGGNEFGQLGNGTTAPRLTAGPVSVADAIDLGSGREHAMALRSGGTVVTWGHNDLGQIGDGTSSNRPTPVPVPGLTGVVSVAGGHYHSLALLSNGTVRSWGFNATGQLGDGTTVTRRSPVAVSSLTSVVRVAAGRDMSYAIRSDGTVWGWGLNSDGELGDGTTQTRTTPVRVGTLTSVVTVVGGRDHGLAVRSDGTVWAWGDNQYGQVGDGTTVDRLSPVQVTGLPAVVGVSAGAHHSMALASDGRVFTWGRNYRGQLGDGTVTQRLRPIQVPGISGAVAIGSGRDHSVAVLSNGTARAWGLNDFGQLGDGTTVNRRSPVVVAGLSGVDEVEGGRDFTVALGIPEEQPDTTPPSVPGKPGGTATEDGTVNLSWAASSDAVSSTLTYRVVRDGSQVGTVQSASTGTVSFSDTNLAPGSSHTYEITAVDEAENVSNPSPVSDPIVVPEEQPDTTPPSVPGKPGGTATEDGTVNLSWAASSDAVSSTLTYRVVRDGSQVGTVQSASTGTVSFSDTNLAPGSSHTYEITAVDEAENVSNPSPVSDPIVVPEEQPDTTPPSVPGKPGGTATEDGTVNLSWAASSDAVSSTLTYRVVRDGSQVGTVQSASTGTVSFSDTNLAPGSSHTYEITAVDEAENVSNPSPVSDPIVVPEESAVVFSDNFSSGSLSAWTTVTRFTVDAASGSPAAPSARSTTTNQTSILAKDLPSTVSNLCVSMRVNVSSFSGSVVLVRLRTAANGAVGRVFLNPAGVLMLRSDVSGVQMWSGVSLGSGWHQIRLCGTVGAAGTWDLYRDGTRIVNAWVANTGSGPVGRVELGNSSAATWTANFDDVVVENAG